MNRGLSMFWAAALALPLSLSLMGATAEAQPAQAPERLITMSGEGKVSAPPDMALISLGVVSEDESAGAALAANTQSMTRVLEAVKAEGIESRDLQTSGFSVEPVWSQPPRNYDNSKPFRAEILGYRVRNNLTVRIRDLDRVGAILDTVVTLGANSVSGPSFTVEDPTPLEDEARRAAMRDALRKGGLYAEAAGVSLGPITRIDESYSRPPQPFEMRAAAAPMAADAAVPIESGELTFQAQVSVSWRIGE